MKITIQQYGSSIIALSVFALLIGVCMSMLEKNSKYVNVLGLFVESAITETVREEETQTKNSAFDIYRNQALPTIFSYGRYEIRTETYTPISSCFYGKDREGTDIPIKVNEIWDANGEQLPTIFYQDTECFYFENAGIYRLVLETEDKYGKTQTAYVKIFVNEVCG